MNLFSVFLIAVGLSMDACAISFAKGICLKKQIKSHAVRLALAFGFFQGFMPLIGWWVGTHFENLITFSFAKGICLKKQIKSHAVRLALAFGFFQGFMPLIGWWVGTHFENLITSVDHWIAFILLGIIGINMIRESRQEDGVCSECIESIPHKEVLLLAVATSIHWIAFILLGIIGINMIRESRQEDGVCSECIESIPHKEVLLLAVATSIDALAVGVSFAFLKVSIISAVFLIGITTCILSFIAVFLGNRIGGKLGKYAEVTGGIILILIGTKILIEHLFR